MPTLADIAAGKFDRSDDGSYRPRVTGPVTQPEDLTVPPPERKIPPVTLADVASGRATRNQDGTYTRHEQTPIDEPSDHGAIALSRDMVLSASSGVTSGVELVGALAEAVGGGDTANALRMKGQNWTQALESYMTPEWKAAANAKFTEGASDWRWWAHNVLQTVPYMVGTMGLGEGVALGARAGMSAFGKEALTETAKKIAARQSRKLGYAIAGGVGGAGESAQGAGQAADEAGLGDEQRRTAERTSILPGAVGGAIAGRTFEHLLAGAGGSVLRGVMANTAGETAEGALSQFGTELGKARVGLGFDPAAIAESGLAEGAIGLVMGGPATVRGARRVKAAAREAERKRQATAEQQALVDRQAKTLRDQRDKLAQDEVAGVQQGVADRQAAATTPMGKMAPRPLGQQPEVWGGAPAVPPQTQPTTPEGQTAAVAAKAKADAATAPKTRTPPDSRPPVWSQMTKGSALDPGTEAGDQHLSSLRDTLRVRNEEVNAAQARLDATGTNPAAKVRFTAQLAEAKRVRDAANKAFEDYFARTSRKRGLPLTGETDLAGMPWTDPPPDPAAVDRLMDDEIQKELDAHFGPSTSEDMEDLFDVGPKVRRSQQARAAALTMWEKRRAATKGASITPIQSPAPTNRVTDQVTQGTPESAAVATRSQKMTKQATKVTAALEPTPADPTLAATQQPTASPAAPGSDGPGTTPAGPIASQPGVSPEQAPPPPPSPQPQSGGFTPAPVDMRGRSIFPNMQEVTGPEPPQSVLPGVEQALAPTQPRKKSLANKSPLERLKLSLAQGPRGLDAVLAAVQDGMNNAKDTRRFKLIERLRKIFPHSVAKPLRVIVENRTLFNGIQAIYDPKADRIYIDLAQAEDGVQALMHEAVHAAAVYSLRTNKSLQHSITSIRENASQQWTRLGFQPDTTLVYGFANNEEFVSEVLTNSQFADTMAGLPISDMKGETRSLWSQFKRRIATMAGVPQDPQSDAIFERVLEMVLDGGYLDPSVRQEQLQQLENLGIGHAAALLTDLRTMMRQPDVQRRLGGVTHPVTRGYEAGGKGSVWAGQLPFISMDQLAQSYGDVGKFYVDADGESIPIPHDPINSWVRNLDLRDGHVTALRSTASRIDEVGKLAANDTNANHKDLEDIIINSTMWGLWANKDAAHPDNAEGLRLPGRAELLPTLNEAWSKLTGVQQDFYRLSFFFSQAQRSRDMQDIMIWRAKARQGEVASTLLEKLIKSKPTIDNRDLATGEPPSGILLSYNEMPAAWELQEWAALVAREKGLDRKAQKKLYKDVRDVHKAFGQRVGPYFPLRRLGNYYAMMRSAEKTLPPMDRAAYDRMIHDNIMLEGGDLEVTEELFDPQTKKYTLKVRNIFVSSEESEFDANDKLAEKQAEWDKRGIEAEPGGKRAALKRSDAYAGLALQSASFEALRKDVMEVMEKEVGKEAAQSASDAILKYYLEVLPEGSVRKAQMRARLIAGPSRDVLHVFSQYANGAAYFSGQAKFGSKMSTAAGAHMNEAIRFLHDKGQTAQANDLQTIQNFLTNRNSSYDRAASKSALEIGQDWFGLQSAWRRFPQVVTAFLLTGPGTTAINAIQGPMLGFPLLASQHGAAPSASAMLGAMRDTTSGIVGEALDETVRTVKGLPGAAKVAVGAQRFTSPIRNPHRSMVERVMQNLVANATDKKMAQMEADHLHALAMRKKIDFGLTAEVQQMATRANGKWTALQYLMDAAFVVPQAVETSNRITMALASFRLNMAKVTQEVMADEAVLPEDKEATIQSRLVDQSGRDIDQSMWNYSPSNQMTIAQHELFRWAAVFKTFAQRMTYSVLHNFVASFNARTKAERWQARKMIGGLLATTYIGAGTMGWITLDPLYAVAVALTAMFSDDDDPEQALRSALTGFIDEDWMPMVNLILKGPVYASGAADLSRTAFPSVVNWNSDESSIYGTLGEAMLGAPGSVLEQMYKGVSSIANGNIMKGAEQMTPKAFGINDFIRAVNYYNKGLTDSQDIAYGLPRDVSLRAVIERGLGIEVPYISERKAVRRGFIAKDENLRTNRNELLASYAQAVRAKDKAGRMKALTKIKQFNKSNVGYGITREQVENSLRNRREQEYVLGKYGVRATKPGQRRLLETVKARYGM